MHTIASFKDIKIDESCAMSDDDNDSVEEHSNKETEILTESQQSWIALVLKRVSYKTQTPKNIL